VKVQQVAEELGARYVLEGSVRMAGSRVRITAQLIDAETGHHVWADKYDRELEDIFALQDEITQRIAAVIEPELQKSERKRNAIRQPMNLGAWECYQRGMSFLYEFTRDGTAQARAMFAQAIERDPSYSQAYSGLAYSHHRDLFLGFTASRDESLANFRQAARRAVALDEADSYAHWMLGMVYMWDGNFDLAVAQGERSVELNPSNSISYVQLGVALTYAGKPAEGIPHIEKCLQLNPNDPRAYIYFTHLADAYLNAEKYADAAEAARKAIRGRTDFIEARLIRASAFAHLGRIDEARAELDECRRIDRDFAEPSANWHRYRSQANVDHLFEGLRKAGLEA
jgi:adenylate cyclase